MMKRRMMVRTAATVALLAASGWLGRARAADPTAFVKGVGDRLVAVVNGSGGAAAKHAALTSIVDASVDVHGVAQFCLGRFWRAANADEQRQYLDAFHAMLVNSIAGALGDYPGVRFSVGGAARREGGVVVLTTIERPNNKPAKVEWLIADVGGSPKIQDMITEGVSLRLTERSDYAAFLAGNGNNLRNLIDSLRKKAASAHA